MKDVVEEEEEEEKRKKMRLQPVSTASGVGSKGKNEFSFLMGKRESRVEETSTIEPWNSNWKFFPTLIEINEWGDYANTSINDPVFH